MSHFLITLDFDFRILSLHLHLFFLLLLDQLQPLRGDQQYRSLTEPTEYRFDSYATTPSIDLDGCHHSKPRFDSANPS